MCRGAARGQATGEGEHETVPVVDETLPAREREIGLDWENAWRYEDR